MKSLKHVAPILLALTLAAMLSGCSKNTSPTGLDAAAPALDQAPPAVPAQIVSDWNGATSRGTLEWTPSSSANVASYQVYQYSPDPALESAYVLIGQTDSGTTQYVLPRMTQDTEYYRLRATSTAGVESAWSATIEVTVGAPLGSDPEPGDGITLKIRP